MQLSLNFMCMGERFIPPTPLPFPQMSVIMPFTAREYIVSLMTRYNLPPAQVTDPDSSAPTAHRKRGEVCFVGWRLAPPPHKTYRKWDEPPQAARRPEELRSYQLVVLPCCSGVPNECVDVQTSFSYYECMK